MQIRISEKLTVFSHKMGSKVILPKTTLEVQIFPTKIIFLDLENLEKKESFCILDLKGPFKNFTILQDIEKAIIEVFGFCENGFFKYKIFADNKKIKILLLKAPNNFITFLKNKKKEVLRQKELFIIKMKIKVFEKKSLEKLFLDVHKKPDIFFIFKRLDLKEILPFWFCLGKDLDLKKKKINLFKEMEKMVFEKCSKILLESVLLKIFQKFFSDLFSPRTFDEKYQNIDIEIDKKISPLVLLEQGACFIRSLFFIEEENSFKILPFLLPSFFSGRFINIESSVGKFDIVWSKKKLKKMILKSTKTKKILFSISKIKSFRLKENRGEKGKIFKADEFIYIEKDKIYFFDRFQK